MRVCAGELPHWWRPEHRQGGELYYFPPTPLPLSPQLRRGNSCSPCWQLQWAKQESVNNNFSDNSLTPDSLCRFVMQYLTWRVLAGLNRKIEISFLLVGHTKFAPDWCFGLVKFFFRKTLVGCLDDIVRVVNQSASTNHAQLVGKEDGTTFVDQYDWAGFFQPFFRRGAFDGIKSWRHIVFSSATPGKAMARTHCDAEEQMLSLLAKNHLGWKPCPTDLPSILPPPGLPLERKKYLFDKIRHKDTVCPNPLPTLTSSSLATPTPYPLTMPTPSLEATLTPSPEAMLSPEATPTPSPPTPPRKRKRC